MKKIGNVTLIDSPIVNTVLRFLGPFYADMNIKYHVFLFKILISRLCIALKISECLSYYILLNNILSQQKEGYHFLSQNYQSYLLLFYDNYHACGKCALTLIFLFLITNPAKVGNVSVQQNLNFHFQIKLLKYSTVILKTTHIETKARLLN